jgi:hypothetical protein
MDIEDLDLNPFFRALRTEHHDIWSAASSNGWLLCVPQASSLRGNTARIDIETHVLQPSRSFPGEFLTLTGNVVTVVGSEIHTKSGFVESRRVKILYTEEFTENEEDETDETTTANTRRIETTITTNTTNDAGRRTGSSVAVPVVSSTERIFSIIHIGRPLIGGVNAPSSADEMDRSVIVK